MFASSDICKRTHKERVKDSAQVTEEKFIYMMNGGLNINSETWQPCPHSL